jgi:hypothetical protein
MQTELMKYGSGVGTATGLSNGIPGCNEDEINISFDFNSINGETRTNLTCGDNAMVAVTKCNAVIPVCLLRRSACVQNFS